MPDVYGNPVEQTTRVPVWIEPQAKGSTLMCEALKLSHDILQAWVMRNQTAHPPVVVHITDGEATDGNPAPLMEAIMDLRTGNGPANLFNVHLSSSRSSVPTSFPDTADGLPDEAQHPQHVEVAGGVVVEEVALVEAVQALAGEVARPGLERAQIHPETGSGEEVCDDESEGKTEREDHEDRADGSLRPGHPRRRSCASLGPAGRGASHRERLLHERGRWTGA
jgi:hypothetical protein